MKLDSEGISVYRVGLGADMLTVRNYAKQGKWWEARYSVRRAAKSARRRSWWGLWQAEWPTCEHAVRGLTATHARRRAQFVLRSQPPWACRGTCGRTGWRPDDLPKPALSPPEHSGA